MAVISARRNLTKRSVTAHVDRTGRYSNRSVPGKKLGLLDLLIRCEKELVELAALLREGQR